MRVVYQFGRGSTPCEIIEVCIADSIFKHLHSFGPEGVELLPGDYVEEGRVYLLVGVHKYGEVRLRLFRSQCFRYDHFTRGDKCGFQTEWCHRIINLSARSAYRKTDMRLFKCLEGISDISQKVSLADLHACL